jgi:hypothetical protein
MRRLEIVDFVLYSSTIGAAQADDPSPITSGYHRHEHGIWALGARPSFASHYR